LELSEEKDDLSHWQGKIVQQALHDKSINLIRNSLVAFRKICQNFFVYGFLPHLSRTYHLLKNVPGLTNL